MPVGYKWHPITDLPEDPRSLTDGELEALGRVWKRQKQDLTDPVALEEFNKRLRREWAIETGVIENVYTIDRGVTRTLIEKGIDAALIPHGTTDRDGTVVARIIQDHYETLEGLFDFVGGSRQLSTSYIKELQAALLRNQQTYAVVDRLDRAFEKPLEKGQYKLEANSPTRPDGSVHEYCPPEHVATEMDNLVAWHAEHEAHGVPSEVEAAWLHHRFTQIHPFADGNGRVARAISTLVFIKAGWFPLIVKREDWTRYVEALEKADQDDLRPLVAMFVEAQRNALILATEAVYEARPITSAEEAIAAVRDRLVQRGKLALPGLRKAEETASLLGHFASQRLLQIAQQMDREMSEVGKDVHFELTAAPAEIARAWALESIGQVPKLEEYNDLLGLRMEAGRRDQFVLSFHALGPQYRGIIGVVAYLVVEGREPKVLEGGTFQINYEEEPASAESRFSKWLERMIVEGLNRWRESL
jgi:fido (protein-threonine AMPylation protein)